jgi:hypothetical protein
MNSTEQILENYPEIDKFVDVKKKLDPFNLFSNAFTDSIVNQVLHYYKYYTSNFVFYFGSSIRKQRPVYFTVSVSKWPGRQGEVWPSSHLSLFMFMQKNMELKFVNKVYFCEKPNILLL